MITYTCSTRSKDNYHDIYKDIVEYSYQFESGYTYYTMMIYLLWYDDIILALLGHAIVFL